MANKTSRSLKKQLCSPNLKCQTKCMQYKTLIRPVLLYGSECWPLSNTDGNMHWNIERRILRLICSPVSDNGVWRTRYNSELYVQPDVVKVVKIGRLRWLGHLCIMKEADPCRKLILPKPEGTWHVGKPKLRWLESFEEDLKNIGVRNWRQVTRSRRVGEDFWRG
jgi:hypothetical protein